MYSSDFGPACFGSESIHGRGYILMAGCTYSRPQTPPSHEEKRSGEPSRISWASARFCDGVTQQRFAEYPLKKVRILERRGTTFTVVRDVMPVLGNKCKKFDFAHQTGSRREARVGWARD